MPNHTHGEFETCDECQGVDLNNPPKDKTAEEIRTELQGDTQLVICNQEAGSFSRLWGRDCWVADSVLSLIQSSIDEKMDSQNLDDPLFKVWTYCKELREKNRIGEFPETID